MGAEQKKDQKHVWTFTRTGGVDQVLFQDGQDIAMIGQLDQALWMALAMPVKGTGLDPATAALIDRNNDGRILPAEIIEAVEWAGNAFTDLGDLMQGGDAVELRAIRAPALLATSKRILSNLGKADAEAITLADVSNLEQIFRETRFNGDGVIIAECAGDTALRQAIIDIQAVLGSIPDRSGKPGINQTMIDEFFAQARACLVWTGKANPSEWPLPREAIAGAFHIFEKVKNKIDDYFVRCRLVAFEWSDHAGEIRRMAELPENLSPASPAVRALPLAPVAQGRALPLDAGQVNPAWAQDMAAFAGDVVVPLLGEEVKTLAEADWEAIRDKFRPYQEWFAAKPATAIDQLGQARLAELLDGPFREDLAALVQCDLARKEEYEQLVNVEKMIRFHRDLFRLLCNYVNFSEFYGPSPALFQIGTLMLDARCCDLCMEVLDPARHAALAILSAACLAYCDITRKGEEKRSIVAVITDGDADNLMVGRNGIFYDHEGRSWDATITRLVSNPISVREAFWLPYKKLARLIEEQLSRRALAAEQESLSKMSETAAGIVAADAPGKDPKSPKKIDLGTIALIGTAVGGMSALVGGFLQALFGLGFWLPLGLLGVILLISGPSMLLGWLKLRSRNLGPLLDANGWAVNTRAMINMPFGASMTRVAAWPSNSRRALRDPYAKKQTRLVRYGLLLILLLLLLGWWSGRLTRFMPDGRQRSPAEKEAGENAIP